ncbi:uncharacterized protein LOC131160068 [Malania oleifera]|uniref:uncharacterized protein LOC131160068 n=1 Tax=Malania oleifera TaxID=397392 RepID=UPI0025ADDE3F|nr:uncharacterized protein LOC131160068 [Malania oleifera]
MSARSLRKVLKEQEEQQRPSLKRNEEEGGGGENESDSPDSCSPSRNPFDLLDDQDQVNESDIVAETLAENVDEKEPSVRKSVVAAVPKSNYKSKKKKKNKGNGNLFSSSDKVEKPLDVVLENLSLNEHSSGNQPGLLKSKAANVRVFDSQAKQCTHSILQVDPKYLNAENELRRIFGSKVVNLIEKSNQVGSSRQTRGVKRGSHILKKTTLVSPLDHWPRWDGSLSMEHLESKNGYHYFRYVQSFSYGQAQKAFEAAKAIHDLNGIASILFHNPYHMESLITMAEYFEFVGEHQMAADSIAKCLYGLECAWHPMFTPLQGNCQIKYSHERNKPLFSSLFIHMKNMDRRGCHRSALEVCKLLLSLDSDDPMGALFCIDYYSLRAEECSWLERFSEYYRSDNSLWLFPNFSYSLAICRFYLERLEASKDGQAENAKATSTDLMKQALLLHPSVIKKLVAKVPLKDRGWTDVLKNSFFGSDQTGNPSLDHLINIYIARSYIIWRLPDLQKLLMNAAILVIETLKCNRNEAKDWACVRKEAFSSEKNEYGHLLVSDFSDSVPTMPPDNLQNFMADPRMREVQNGGEVANPLGIGGGGARVPRDLNNRSTLAALFESMLPWIDYGDARGGDDQIDDRENENENENEGH